MIRLVEGWVNPVVNDARGDSGYTAQSYDSIRLERFSAVHRVLIWDRRLPEVVENALKGFGVLTKRFCLMLCDDVRRDGVAQPRSQISFEDAIGYNTLVVDLGSLLRQKLCIATGD